MVSTPREPKPDGLVLAVENALASVIATGTLTKAERRTLTLRTIQALAHAGYVLARRHSTRPKHSPAELCDCQPDRPHHCAAEHNYAERIAETLANLDPGAQFVVTRPTQGEKETPDVDIHMHPCVQPAPDQQA